MTNKMKEKINLADVDIEEKTSAMISKRITLLVSTTYTSYSKIKESISLYKRN
jgi:hypothetical protein